MPKHSVGAAMKNHLAQAVTTLAGCWRIVRTDGQQFGFTTFDSDLTIEGVLYRSIDGFSSTAIQSGATGQVDNLQVLGFFAQEGDTGGVIERDVKNRLFDYARIYLFFINWASPSSLPPIRMRTGWLGETVVAPNGSFSAELRALPRRWCRSWAISTARSAATIWVTITARSRSCRRSGSPTGMLAKASSVATRVR
jgi:uncharacterized phage protein (TIGR02218 family)